MPIHGYPGNVISATPPSVTPAGASGVFTTEQQMQYQTAGNWPMAATQISRSLRFNSADSASLNRTPSSAGNRKTWTWSGWVKKSLPTGNQQLFAVRPDASNLTLFYFFVTGEAFRFTSSGTSIATLELITTQVFRDPSAWYHIVVSLDTTQATASNRAKIYVNGSQITAFTTETYPAQNSESLINSTNGHRIGAQDIYGNYLDGYMTEVNFIDGQALTPSSFGQTNSATGVWEPRQYTGPYGTNGFYLNFSDNSGTTSTTLGKDYSGNGNNWTPNNFSVTAGAGNDSLVDTPTPYGTDTGAGGEVRGNYATINPLDTNESPTINNGNLNITGGGSAFYYVGRGTFGMSSGKWYWEATINSAVNSTYYPSPGIVSSSANVRASGYQLGSNADGFAYMANGQKYTGGSLTNYGASFTQNDVIGFALDMDAGTLTCYKNGSSQGTIASSLTGTWFPSWNVYSSTALIYNFGQRPFAYTAPSGFKALCTQNLPTPTIGATATTRADDYFNTVLYTGNGTTQTISGVGFQPDLVWAKSRSNAYWNTLVDAVRGRAYALFSNVTNAEFGPEPSDKELTAFTSDGFSLGPDFNYSINSNGATFVAWNWKANGAGSSNTQGTITSTVSANTTAGFSVATYTGNGSNSGTIGHGLGVTPSMVIFKNRGSAESWRVYHTSLGVNAYVLLNSTAASASDTGWIGVNSTTLNFGGSGAQYNANTNTYVAYVFAPVAGYSAFGSYTGNGSSDGTFVYTGFRPAYVLFKQSSSSGIDWMVFDNKRSPYNATQARLFPSLSNAEVDGAPCDFLSNGFKMRENNSYNNASGQTYVYAAFAEFPFKYTLAR